MKQKIILIGGGGHAESIIDSINRMNGYKIIGILDQQGMQKQVLNVKIIGDDKSLPDFYKKGIHHAVIAIGAIGNSLVRRKLYEYCKEIGYILPNIIDPSAIVSSTMTLGEGNFIGKRAVINANVRIGNGCIINTGAIIEHGCSVEDFAHLAPGTVLCGAVKIKKDGFLGAGSVVLPQCTIGENSIVGAGSLVLSDIGSNKIAYGHPAKEVREWST